jgi:hypothetical protein
MAMVAARRDSGLRIGRQSPVGKWHVAHLEIAALTQLVRHVGRYILRPLLSGVETDDPVRVLILAVQQISDHGFQIGGLDIGLPVNAAVAAEVVHHEVYVLVVAFRDDGWCPACSGHTQYSNNNNAM